MCSGTSGLTLQSDSSLLTSQEYLHKSLQQYNFIFRLIISKNKTFVNLFLANYFIGCWLLDINVVKITLFLLESYIFLLCHGVQDTVVFAEVSGGWTGGRVAY